MGTMHHPTTPKFDYTFRQPKLTSSVISDVKPIFYIFSPFKYVTIYIYVYVLAVISTATSSPTFMEHSPSPKLHGRSTSEVPTKESVPLTQTASTASPWNTISTLQTKTKMRDIVTSTVLIPFSLTVANRTIASTTIPRSVAAGSIIFQPCVQDS